MIDLAVVYLQRRKFLAHVSSVGSFAQEYSVSVNAMRNSVTGCTYFPGDLVATTASKCLVFTNLRFRTLCL